MAPEAAAAVVEALGRWLGVPILCMVEASGVCGRWKKCHAMVRDCELTMLNDWNSNGNKRLGVINPSKNDAKLLESSARVYILLPRTPKWVSGRSLATGALVDLGSLQVYRSFLHESESARLWNASGDKIRELCRHSTSFQVKYSNNRSSYGSGNGRKGYCVDHISRDEYAYLYQQDLEDAKKVVIHLCIWISITIPRTLMYYASFHLASIILISISLSPQKLCHHQPELGWQQHKTSKIWAAVFAAITIQF